MDLNGYKKCFNLSYDEFVWLHNIPSDQIHENLRYEKISEVTRINLDNNLFFFFKDGNLKMIYTSDDVLTKKIWDEFKSTPNTNIPEKEVRSRAGKISNQLIFASHGFTASVSHDEVDFIEIYPPCSLEEYLEKIYREPQKFIR